MKRKLTVLKLLQAAVLLLALWGIQRLLYFSSRVEVHGHRGARAARPENTIPAFEYALQIGVDVLELDLAVTKDKVLVVSHDPRINPKLCLGAESSPLLYSLTLEEVRKFDCGSLAHPNFSKQVTVPGARIPTLAEVFKLVKNSRAPAASRVKFNIETKIRPDRPGETPDPETFAVLVLDEASRYQMLDRIILQSFDFRTLAAARKRSPQISISLLVEDEKMDLVEIAKEHRPEFVSPRGDLLRPWIVGRLHGLGVKVAPWTLNKPLEWRLALIMGADAIITDDPAKLLRHLGRLNGR